MSAATGLDTNVLVRYYVDDATDSATAAQRKLARRLIESGKPLQVCKTVLLELEWVLRGYYRFSDSQIQSVFAHLLALPHLSFENRPAIERALQSHQAGLDFADALHHASYHDCAAMISFDDSRFARRSKKLGLIPSVNVPR